jgi:hypothetical protein
MQDSRPLLRLFRYFLLFESHDGLDGAERTAAIGAAPEIRSVGDIRTETRPGTTTDCLTYKRVAGCYASWYAGGRRTAG